MLSDTRNSCSYICLLLVLIVIYNHVYLYINLDIEKKNCLAPSGVMMYGSEGLPTEVSSFD